MQKNYFNFSRADRLGILGLCGCVILMLTIKWSLPYWAKQRSPDITSFVEDIAQFRKTVHSVDHAIDISESPIHIYSTPELFYFDPNRTSDNDWKKLGLNQRQIQNIRNYQARGGYFKRKEDLQKLYTIPSTLYQMLEPYIRFSGSEAVVKQAEKSTKVYPVVGKESERTTGKETKLRIELNTADSSLLTQLYGIGPALASRTVKYRSRIGGFVDVMQLAEVYGIHQELVERLTPQLWIDSSFIKKIPVNTATFRELINHPYLNEQQVRGILNYLKLQKRINNLDELVQNNILKREEAEKIKPYLAFE